MFVSKKSGFISTVVSKNHPSLKYMIPFCSIDIKYIILFVSGFVFVSIILLALSEFYYNDEYFTLSCYPVSGADIIGAKFNIVLKIITMLTVSGLTPYVLLYERRVFKLLTPIYTGIYYRLVLLLLTLFSVIMFYAVVVLFNLLLLTLVFILFIILRNRFLFFKYTGKILDRNLIIIIIFFAVLFSLFTLPFFSKIVMERANIEVAIFGPFPISYLSTSIIAVMKPEPNIMLSLMHILILIITDISLIFLLMLSCWKSRNSYNACFVTRTFRKISLEAKNKNYKPFNIISKFPLEIKIDITSFIRGGESLKNFSRIFITLLSMNLITVFIVPYSKITILNLQINKYFLYLIFPIPLIFATYFPLYSFSDTWNAFLFFKIVHSDVKRFLILKILCGFATSVSVFMIATIFSILFIKTESYYFWFLFVFHAFLLLVASFAVSLYFLTGNFLKSFVLPELIGFSYNSFYMVIAMFFAITTEALFYKILLRTRAIFSVALLLIELLIFVSLFFVSILKIVTIANDIELCNLLG